MKIKTHIAKHLYKPYKKILFLQDPEKVHDKFTNLGEKLGKSKFKKGTISKLFNYQNKKLEKKILGITLKNPIGLAAGFDYEGKLTQILPSVGFGFHTIGSVTYRSYEGNPKPRLARLIKSKSILVNKGLKNTGSKNIISNLKNLNFEIPLGISIAKTNCKTTSTDKAGIKDYIQSLKLWESSKLGSYYEINISCPNVFGGEPFTTPKKLDFLLREIDKLKIKKPIFLKMPIDLTEKQTNALCEVALKHNIHGLIFGNLTKNRNNPHIQEKDLNKISSLKGNLSGLPTKELSNKLIKFAYKKYKDKFIIIGCGGVFSAKDAYEKIKLGASLIQLITGIIYQGPQLIGEINQGLISLLEKDGYKNISEAVGENNG
ncbi:MAG: quinone-dependent dihydroorotate dehydrogenase [archaeon]